MPRIFASFLLLACLASCAAGPVPPYIFPPADTPPQIPYSRGAEWEAFHAMLKNHPQKAQSQLLFLGDSITQRWGADVLHAHWGAYTPLAFGIGGDRTQQLLWRLGHGELDGAHPKAIVLLIGTNNLEIDTPEAIAGGIRQLIGELRRMFPTSRIVLMGILPRGQSPDDPYREKIRAVNRLIEPYGKLRNVRYVDMSELFLRIDGTIPQGLMPDYLHLSRAGYETVAQALQPLLMPALDK